MPIALRVFAISICFMACALTVAAQAAAGGNDAAAAASLNRTALTVPTARVLNSTAAPVQNDSPYRLKRGDNEFGGWGGIAFNATTIFGGLRDDEADDRKLVIAAFRYGRTLAANKDFALQYTLDAIPLAIATGNIAETTTVVTPTGTVTTHRRETAYGAGLTPLGLQLDFANSSKVHPFVHVGGGFLVFNKSVPLPDAGQFAYVGEGSAGLRVFTSDRRAWSFGVRLHHISNGNRAGANRGLNEFIFFAGFSIFR
ncbi:MAG TPA: acyloxyacyl hydrolase [Pyrinomonadaceae bacterium]|nr:acyloxyacyl hydrolase [Pyrinomonadaceae bacterium]